MSAETNKNVSEEAPELNETATDETVVAEENTTGEVTNEGENQEVNKTEAELSEMKDKYLRLYSEFDNYKRRTAKERIDLAKTANQEMIVALLPVVDDFERARQSMQNAQDIESVKAGVELIFNKLAAILQQKGLTPMEATGQPFDAEIHEAITQIPAPDESLKGKVIDEVEKGYYLNDKVVRFAKVVIGA